MCCKCIADFLVGDRVRSIISGRYGRRNATVVGVGPYCIDIRIDYNGAIVPYDRKEIERILPAFI